jgi:hypothetical protein
MWRLDEIKVVHMEIKHQGQKGAFLECSIKEEVVSTPSREKNTQATGNKDQKRRLRVDKN